MTDTTQAEADPLADQRPSSLIVAVDFDGTIARHRYPEVGEPVPDALDSLRELVQLGALLILWTIRDGKECDAAVEFLRGHGIELYGVNFNPSQGEWSKSRKVYAHVYVDDAAAGTPLIADGERGMVNWPSLMPHLRALAKARA